MLFVCITATALVFNVFIISPKTNSFFDMYLQKTLLVGPVRVLSFIDADVSKV